MLLILSVRSFEYGLREAEPPTLFPSNIKKGCMSLDWF